MPILYIATSNPGKLRDFAHAAPPTITLKPLPNLAHIPEPDETADTFEGNAVLKALAYSAHAPGQIVLADDSGLELPALGNAPGVRSARFAQDNAFTSSAFDSKDELNNQCLLQAAAALAPDERLCRYRCVLAAARDNQILALGHGTLEGRLLDTPRGDQGFGYDPLFLLPHLNLTMAEIPQDTRQHYSHRIRALADLLPRLTL